MAPIVSIIIPCYNQGFYLAQAIRSVQFQTFENWEAVIVDDGSTDETHDIVSRMKDVRMRYVYQENHGLSAARNRGILSANAPIIALLDSDDQWEPTFLERMLECLDCHPDAVASYCGHSFINAQGQSVGSPSVKVVPPHKFRQILIDGGNWLVPSEVVFKRVPTMQGYLFDESLGGCADTDFWYRMSERHNLVGLDEILVRYRIHDGSMSMNPEYMVADFWRFIVKTFGSPDAPVSQSGQSRKKAFTAYNRYAAWKYGKAGDFQKSATHFLELYELSPSKALSMGMWRTLARIHLPLEDRGRVFSRKDLDISANNITCILDEIILQLKNSSIGSEEFNRIKGCAFLALAEESVYSKLFRKIFRYLLHSAKCWPSIIFSRSYWGTFLRGITSSLGSRKNLQHGT